MPKINTIPDCRRCHLPATNSDARGEFTGEHMDFDECLRQVAAAAAVAASAPAATETLRDSFAMASLTGIMATFRPDTVVPLWSMPQIAREAYAMADAMLIERAK